MRGPPDRGKLGRTTDGRPSSSNIGRRFGIAYRMLGSVTDAEDVMRPAWLRWWSRTDGPIEKPATYLAGTVNDLSLSRLRSATAVRERGTRPGDRCRWQTG